MMKAAKYLITAMKRSLWILMIVGLSLAGCSKGGFSPGPQGPIGPQGDIGPQGNLGPSRSRDIGPKGNLGPSSSDLKKGAILIEDTGVLVKHELSLAGFSKIEIRDFFEVEVRQGMTYRVMVEAEEALTPYIDVCVRGRKLKIGLKSGYRYNFESASQRVDVTLPALTLAMVGNFSELRLDGFETEEDLRLEVTDHSSLEGSVAAGKLQVEVSNHSLLDLAGSASQVTGEVTNHSSADITGLKASEVNIDTDIHSTLGE